MIYNCKEPKQILFRYVRHPIRLFMLFPFPIPFCSFRTVKLNKNNDVLFGLSLVCNRYPQFCHMSDMIGAIKSKKYAKIRNCSNQSPTLALKTKTEITNITNSQNIKRTYIVNQVSSYFQKGGYSATETELKII